MINQSAFKITKPISAWNKPLKMDFKELLKSLSKAAIHATIGKWEDIPFDVVDAATAMGLQKDPGGLAWLLVNRALYRALNDLVSEQCGFVTVKDEKKLDKLVNKIDFSLEKTEETIDKNFFKNPGALKLVQEFKKPLTEWLQNMGLSKVKATAVSNRLGSYFTYGLNEEWRKNSSAYEALQKALSDTPFTPVTERERGWAAYRARLQRQVELPMFGEAFGLNQVYIPLRAYYREKVDSKSEQLEMEIGERMEIAEEKMKQRQVVVDLEREIEAWLNDAAKEDAIRVICGGPGSGKSSLLKMFAAKKAADNGMKILFVPLHQFEPEADLVDAMGKFLRFEGKLGYNPLDPDDQDLQLLVIFDGLDELAMRGKVSVEVAADFVREVQSKLERFNQDKTRLLVMIGGRELVVQACQRAFRKPKQILHILNYHISEEAKKELTGPKKLIEQDQRTKWWKKYGVACGKKYKRIPQELKKPKLEEITAQPLLNYLLALSFQREKLEFKKESNVNKIFEDLIENVHVRVWEENRNPEVGDLSKENFFRIMEEIALSAWHGDGRKTTIKEIEYHMEISRLSTHTLDIFKKGAETGISRLLAAFYFRQSGYEPTGGDPTFEFTHKSFSEYLTARRIVREMELISNGLEAYNQEDPLGIDKKEALRRWALICGPTAMDHYIFDFLLNEIALRDKQNWHLWQKDIADLIGYMLKNGVPMNALGDGISRSFKRMTEWARNAEESLLACLNACALLTKEISHITWPSPIAFGTWIRRLQGQRSGPENCLAYKCLSYLNLDYCVSHMSDFYWANFSKSSFKHFNSNFTCFIGADLFKAKMQYAWLSEANLEGANLEGANLQKAGLIDAKLSRANLHTANLEGARLYNTDLSKAKLNSANLRGAKLQGANLCGADLRGAKITKTQLKVCNIDNHTILPDGSKGPKSKKSQRG